MRVRSSPGRAKGEGGTAHALLSPSQRSCRHGAAGHRLTELFPPRSTPPPRKRTVAGGHRVEQHLDPIPARLRPAAWYVEPSPAAVPAAGHTPRSRRTQVFVAGCALLFARAGGVEQVAPLLDICPYGHI